MALFDEDHLDTLETKNDLASPCKKQIKYDKAESLFLEAPKGRRLKLGDRPMPARLKLPRAVNRRIKNAAKDFSA